MSVGMSSRQTVNGILLSLKNIFYCTLNGLSTPQVIFSLLFNPHQNRLVQQLSLSGNGQARGAQGEVVWFFGIPQD
jgi:hypothetical protein